MCGAPAFTEGAAELLSSTEAPRAVSRNAAGKIHVDEAWIVADPGTVVNTERARAQMEGAVVFSMSRVIVLAFAIAVLRHVWRVGVPGWPDATLAIAIVLALPLLGALERMRPTAVAEIANQEMWQRATVAAVTVSGDRTFAEKVLQAVEDEAAGILGGTLTDTSVEWME